MHFCQDELIAIQAALTSAPVIGYLVVRGRHLWHWLWHRGSPKADGCCPPGHDHGHEDLVPSGEEHRDR